MYRGGRRKWQRTFLCSEKKYFIFWTYLIERKDISMNTYRIWYDTIVDEYMYKKSGNDYLKVKENKERYITK
jgi:hypothetical protein